MKPLTLKQWYCIVTWNACDTLLVDRRGSIIMSSPLETADKFEVVSSIEMIKHSNDNQGKTIHTSIHTS